MKDDPINELSSLQNKQEEYERLAENSLEGTNLMVMLSDEGGLPVYTKLIHVNDDGEISYRNNSSVSPVNENIVLMSGLIEAIMQLKDILQPTLLELATKPNSPLYVDYAKVENGIALVSLATTPDFQKLPSSLLNNYTPNQADLAFPVSDKFWEKNFEISIGNSFPEESSIYRKILGKIKVDLEQFISFILVYDDQGTYLFSTAKKYENFSVSDPLLEVISQFIKREYLKQKFKENFSLIGAKRLKNSVIWHFKCQEKIFVFFTYIIPDLYDFEILKAEMITFITNNIEKFITTIKTFSMPAESPLSSIQNSRFIFLS
jgi:hypothetical protein